MKTESSKYEFEILRKYPNERKYIITKPLRTSTFKKIVKAFGIRIN